MTLELNKIADQVASMGQSAANRKQKRDEVLPQVRGLLSTHADDAVLRAKVNKAISVGWRGAIPKNERLDLALDPPALPERVTLVATDGSQIYPDQHSLALYYVINIGSIVLRLGTGEAPIATSTPTVCFDEQQLYGDDEYVISGQVVSARRTVAETTQLVELSIEEAKSAPVVALADGNLALRARQETIPPVEREKLEKDYIDQLNRVRHNKVPIAGFISRPGTSAVAALMQLATWPSDEIETRVKNNKGRVFEGIVDTAIFDALLAPGQRSAVFEIASGWSKLYQDKGHAIHFFYLNVSKPPRTSIARVEVPEWVVENASMLGMLHAALVEQCRITAIAYPYVLIRADELAVISSDEKANFEHMIGVSLLQQGIEPRASEKAETKQMARYGKSRR